MIDSYLKDSAFTAVKRDAKFYTRYVKGVPFVNRRYTKGVPFSWKMVYKWVGLDLGAEPPDINIWNIQFNESSWLQLINDLQKQ